MVALQELDLEADWDPEAHDRQMRELYENDAAELGEDDVVYEEKPTWDDDIDITDIVPHGLDTDDEGKDPRRHLITGLHKRVIETTEKSSHLPRTTR